MHAAAPVPLTLVAGANKLGTRAKLPRAWLYFELGANCLELSCELEAICQNLEALPRLFASPAPTPTVCYLLKNMKKTFSNTASSILLSLRGHCNRALQIRIPFPQIRIQIHKKYSQIWIVLIWIQHFQIQNQSFWIQVKIRGLALLIPA
jgi:hypothetical protein